MGALNDISGKKFGMLTVIDRAQDYISPGGYRKPMWNCVCECGNTVVVAANRLKTGNTKSCGCGSPNKFIDLTGRKFGKLTVVNKVDNFISKDGSVRTMWNCVCECGNSVTVMANNLKSGKTKSCGCLRKETVKGIGCRHRQMFIETNGYEPPKHMYWVFVDGNDRNYREDNVVFLDRNAYVTAWNNGWLDIKDEELLRTALDVCILRSSITSAEKNKRKVVLV